MKGETELGRVFAGDIVASYPQMGTITVNTRLAKGGEVFARELVDHTGYVHGNNFSSFTGVLLHIWNWGFSIVKLHLRWWSIVYILLNMILKTIKHTFWQHYCKKWTLETVTELPWFCRIPRQKIDSQLSWNLKDGTINFYTIQLSVNDKFRLTDTGLWKHAYLRRVYLGQSFLMVYLLDFFQI